MSLCLSIVALVIVGALFIVVYASAVFPCLRSLVGELQLFRYCNLASR